MKAAVLPLHPKKDTLSSQVTRYLLDFIAQEHLKPGDVIPSEVKVSHDLNVSRGIVREAYRSLSALGILETESGKSSRVRGMSPGVLTQMVGFALRTAHVSAAQVLQLRRVIEIEAARLAAQHGTEAHLECLRECVANMSEAGPDQERLIAADITLHTTLAEATGNPLFALMFEGLRGTLEDSMAQGLKSRTHREEILQIPEVHRHIVEHVCARDAEGAAKAMGHHFDLSVAAILKAGLAVSSTRAQASRKARRGR